MKPIMLLLTSSLVVAASGAFAQGQGDACSNQYGACMDHCSSRPPSLQSQCAQTCETSTNQCYVGMYGHPPEGGEAASQASAPEPEARDAHGQAGPQHQ